MKYLFSFFFVAICVMSSQAQSDAENAYNNGVALSRDQKYTDAIRSYDTAIVLDPSYYKAYYNRGTAKIYLKELKGAISDFDMAVKIKPDFTEAYRNRGVAKLQLDKLDDAIADFSTVIKMDPKNSSAYFMRGQARLQAMKHDEGCADLKRAKALGDPRAEKFIKQYCENNEPVLVQPRRNEHFKLDWPAEEGWKVASDQADSELKVTELVRNGETLDNWTEIGTVMTYLQLHDIAPDAMMDGMFVQARKNFPDAKLTKIEKNDKAAHPWIIFKIESGGDKPESQLWLIMQGSNGMYVSFRAIKAATIPDDLKKKWVAFFKTATVVTE